MTAVRRCPNCAVCTHAPHYRYSLCTASVLDSLLKLHLYDPSLRLHPFYNMSNLSVVAVPPLPVKTQEAKSVAVEEAAFERASEK